jgi:hypothetical protein
LNPGTTQNFTLKEADLRTRDSTLSVINKWKLLIAQGHKESRLLECGWGQV